MKKILSLLAAIALNCSMSYAAGPLIGGRALTTGQILVGVTGSAPVANTVVGTSSQVVVTQGADGGNLAFSFPTSVRMTNLAVSGTLTPTSTSYVYDDLTVNYGVHASTIVTTNTGASSLIVGGGIQAGTGVVQLVDATGKITALTATYLANLSGASLTNLTAANVAAGSLPATVIVSSMSATTVANIESVATSGLVAGGTGITATAGPMTLYSRNVSQLLTTTPTVVGEKYFCNNCSPLKEVVSTGTSMGNFADPAGGAFK